MKCKNNLPVVRVQHLSRLAVFIWEDKAPILLMQMFWASAHLDKFD